MGERGIQIQSSEIPSLDTIPNSQGVHESLGQWLSSYRSGSGFKVIMQSMLLGIKNSINYDWIFDKFWPRKMNASLPIRIYLNTDNLRILNIWNFFFFGKFCKQKIFGNGNIFFGNMKIFLCNCNRTIETFNISNQIKISQFKCSNLIVFVSPTWKRCIEIIILCFILLFWL